MKESTSIQLQALLHTLARRRAEAAERRRQVSARARARARAGRALSVLAIVGMVAGYTVSVAAPAFAASAASIDQCADGTFPVGATICSSTDTADWQNGNINPSNSSYFEGQVVPFRARMNGLAAGSHTYDFQYETTNSGLHAYDYLTTYNVTVPGADPCAGVSGCSGPANTFAIPADPSVPFTPPGPRVISCFGCTITNVAAPFLASGTYAGTSKTEVDVTFSTTTDANPVIAWGGHVASDVNWGPNSGAGSISGSPYHMYQVTIDGAPGAEDRSMKTASVSAPTITTAVSSSNVDINHAVTDTATITGTTAAGPVNGTVNFYVCGPDTTAAGATCSNSTGTPVAGNPVTVNDGGTDSGTATSGNFTPTASGFYCFAAEYVPDQATALYFPAFDNNNTTTECFNATDVEIHINKVADATSVSAGSNIGYTISVTNSGTTDATGVTVTDTLPTTAGTSWSVDNLTLGGVSQSSSTIASDCAIASGVLTCHIGTVPAGTSSGYSIHVTSPTTSASCGTVNNSAAVTTGNDGGANVGPVAITVNCPNIAITKVADSGSVNAGTGIGYTISVTNSGAGDATNVTVTDTLPTTAGTSWTVDGLTLGGVAQSSSTIASDCSIMSGLLTCHLGTIPAGTSSGYTIHLSSPTTSATCPSVSNVASASASNDGSVQTPPAVIDVNCPVVGITKVADNGTVNADSPIGYTIAVTNSGAGDATDVTVTDHLPTTAGTSWTVDGLTLGGVAQSSSTIAADCGITSGTLTCHIGTVPAHTSSGYSIHLSSPTTSATCPSVNNSASVSTGNDGGASVGPVSITVNCPDIAITKVPDNASVSAGDSIGYTISVTNSGAGDATNATVTDTLPSTPGTSWTVDGLTLGGVAQSSSTIAADCTIASGMLTCHLGTVPAHTSSGFSIHISSPTTAATCPSVNNSASVSVGNGSSAHVGPVSITVNCPSLGILKTADAASVSAGSSVGFTVTVSNGGPGDAHSVAVTDSLPGLPGLNWSIDTPPASPATCSVSGSVGSQSLTCSDATLAAMASFSVHITSGTDSATAAASDGTHGTGVVWNSASVTDSVGDSANSHAQEAVLAANIGLTKVADNGTVNAGQPIGYTISVTNTGAGNATGVSVSDTLPTTAGTSWTVDGLTLGGVAQSSSTIAADCSIMSGVLTCNIGTVPAGTTSGYTIHISSPTTSATCPSVSNIASVTAGNDGSAETEPAVITVNCPTVGIAKVADHSIVNAGDTIGYTISVTNSGAGDATNVTVTDTLPTTAGTSWTVDGLTLGGVAQSSSTIASDCAVSSGVLTCHLGTIPAHTSTGYSIHLSSPTTSATCPSVNNSATVATGNGSGSSTGPVTITVNCPSLGIVKTADAASVSAGSPVGFTVTVSNGGPGAANSVSMTDPLPSLAGLNWSIDTPAAAPATCSISGSVGSQSLTCTDATLASGASFSVHITSPTTGATAAASDGTHGAGVVFNLATVTDSIGDSANSSAQETVLGADIGLTKVADNGTVNAGDTIGYTISVTNSGAGNATGVVVTDDLPSTAGTSWTVDGLTLGGVAQSSSTITADCSITSGVLTCNIGSVPADTTSGYTIHLSSPTTTGTCPSVSNVASVSAGNDGTAATEPVVITVNCPTLGITKTADADSVSAGSPVGFTVTVSNGGPGDAHSVVETDALPGLAGLNWTIDTPAASPATCSITGSVGSQSLGCTDATLAAGDSFSVHVTSPTTAATAAASDGTHGTGVVFNLASVTDSVGDSANANASEDVLAPSVGITKVPDSGTVNAGSTIGYTIAVTNGGPGDATDVTITDTLPTTPGLNWTVDNVTTGGDSQTPVSDFCSITAGVLTCHLGTVPAGTTSGYSVHLSSPTTFGTCPSVGNQASVTAGNADGSVGTPVATITVDCPILTATKTSTPAPGSTVSLGQTVTYSITLTNTGNAPTPAVGVTDAVPTGVTYVANSATCGGGSACTVSLVGNTVTWAGIVVLAEVDSTPGTVTLTFQATVNSTDTNNQVISNFGLFSNENTPSCTASTCPTNTVTLTVIVPATAPATTTTTQPTPIVAATSVHTGEPWSGSTLIEIIVTLFGFLLIALGETVRRRNMRALHRVRTNR